MSTRKPPTDAKAANTIPPLRSVRADEVMPVAELRRRLGWAEHATRQARRRGLRIIRLGRQAFVLGADVMEFFQKLADEQSTP